MKLFRGPKASVPQSFIPGSLVSIEWQPFYRSKQYFAYLNYDNALYGAPGALENSRSNDAAEPANDNEPCDTPASVTNLSSSSCNLGEDEYPNEPRGSASPNVLAEGKSNSSQDSICGGRSRMPAVSRRDSDVRELSQGSRYTIPRWAQEHAAIDCEVSVKLMDSLWNASFYEFVRDEQNVDCVARHLVNVVRDMEVSSISNGLSWLIKGWGVDSVACLLKRLTSDWEPDRTALIVGHLTTGWPMRPSLYLLLALLLHGEPAPEVGVFLYSFSRSWSTSMVTELISYLDVVLEWNTDYFKELTKKYIQLACGAVLQTVEARVAMRGAFKLADGVDSACVSTTSSDERGNARAPPLKKIVSFSGTRSFARASGVRKSSSFSTSNLFPAEARGAESSSTSDANESNPADFSSNGLILDMLRSLTGKVSAAADSRKESPRKYSQSSAAIKPTPCCAQSCLDEPIDCKGEGLDSSTSALKGLTSVNDGNVQLTKRPSVSRSLGIEVEELQQPFPAFGTGSRVESALLFRRMSSSSSCAAVSLENFITALASSSTVSLSGIP